MDWLYSGRHWEWRRESLVKAVEVDGQRELREGWIEEGRSCLESDPMRTACKIGKQ